jgi:hypothetical protein
MPHKRSGAQRRAIQKARIMEAGGSQQVSQPQQKVQKQGSSKPPLLKPSLEDVIAAVQSLYADEMKPLGRLLRKRLSERISHSKEGAADVDMVHLRSLCESSSDVFAVAGEDGGDWSVTLVNCASDCFVDVYGGEDTYPLELWAEAAAYFASAPPEDMNLPGGRYSCAQTLQSRKLPFFAGRSLGQICHIVQLAISDKKLLGYCNGAVVPYGVSQSMIKEQSANAEVALNPCQEAAELPCATFDQARNCLRAILEEAASSEEPGQVAVSNVKRMIRTKFQLELSETSLGHSKLTALFQDPRFHDICRVKLEKQGYMIYQEERPRHGFPSSATNDNELAALDQSAVCSVEPLCLSDALETEHSFMDVFEPTPFGQTPMWVSLDQTVPPSYPVNKCAIEEDASYLKHFLHDYLVQPPQTLIQELAETNPPQSLLAEPLSFELADQTCLNMPCEFGPTPAPFGWSPSPHQTTRTRKAAVPSPLPLLLPSLSPWKDGKLDSMVQRTFIHAKSPAKTPSPVSFRRSISTGNLSESTSARSSSCEDFGSLADEVRRQRDCQRSVPATPTLWVPPTPSTPHACWRNSAIPPPLPLPILRLFDHIN